jgi:quercetin dioxygenase-like cupin family protein
MTLSRRVRLSAALSLGLIVAAPVCAQSAKAPAKMEISRAGARPSTRGAADKFTGSVRVDPLFAAKTPSRVSAGSVTFEPGARSNWHTHPLGQYLVITDGLGWTQVEGGPVAEMRPGDVIWCPPGVRHWHGATATTSVKQMAVQEEVDGKNVVWMEPVTDGQYQAGRNAAKAP